MRRTKPTKAAITASEYLVHLPLDELEQALSTEGLARARRGVEQLRLRFDEPTLCEYAYQHGITTGYDRETAMEPEDRRRP